MFPEYTDVTTAEAAAFIEDPTKAVPDPDPGLGIAACQIPVAVDIARLNKPKLLQILAVADADESWPGRL